MRLFREEEMAPAVLDPRLAVGECVLGVAGEVL